MARSVHVVDQESIKPREIMPIALSPVSVPQSLQTASIISGTGNSGTRPAETGSGKNTADKSKESPPAGTDTSQDEKITLSSSSDSGAATYIPAAPYAEIWKDGRKIAEINVRGEVSSIDGFGGGASIGGGGVSSAALRAALYARSVGGEIRVAGMVTDASTLTMRARLSETYGS